MPNEINFPAINGSDGTTCGVFSYGWTSGCTDENNINRGFTQEWFFDGDIGAWVSITVGGTGGGAIINGFTYDTVTHAAPAMSGSGELRQIAFLDPVTGGLTFDYIKTYDVVNPDEIVYSPLNNFEWRTPSNSTYFTANDIPNVGYSLTSGVTLCGDANHQYNIGSGTDGTNGYKWYINRTSASNSSISHFAPPPIDQDDQFSIHPIENTRKYTPKINNNGGAANSQNIPKSVGQEVYLDYISGVSGEILLDNGSSDGVVFGFTTSGGPLVSTYTPTLTYRTSPGGSVSVSTQPSGVKTIRHENWLYFASVRKLDGVDGQTVATRADALAIAIDNNGEALKRQRNSADDNNDNLYGIRVLLDPMKQRNSGSNYNGSVTGSDSGNGTGVTKTNYERFLYELQDEDFRVPALDSWWIIIAIPTRALPLGTSTTSGLDLFIASLYQNGTDSQGTGFNLSGLGEVELTNEYNYTEEYSVFCSVNPSGVGTATPNFKIDM